MLIERQVFVTWYTTEEKLPENGLIVVATISGKRGNVTYDNALALAEYYEGEGWYIEGCTAEHDNSDIKVLAWCDLVPYAWRPEK